MSFVLVKDLSDSLSFVRRESGDINQSLHALIVGRGNDRTSLSMPYDDYRALSSCNRSLQSSRVVAQRCEGNRCGNNLQAAFLKRAHDRLPARTISPRSVDRYYCSVL